MDIETIRSDISLTLGIISTCFWIKFLLGPIYKSYKNKNVIKEFSSNIFVPIFWIIADVINLTGLILDSRYLFQILECSMFIFIDIILISRVIYFRIYFTEIVFTSPFYFVCYFVF